MTQDPYATHLSAEQLQALLEGEVPAGVRSRAEEHLVVCARCSAEMDAWRVLFEDLGGLQVHGPTRGFGARVMSAVEVTEPRSMAARIRERFDQGSRSHVSTQLLQDFLDGELAARRADHVERHLAACGTCTAEADARLDLSTRLAGLVRHAPSAGFAEQVMSAVEVREARPLAARVRSAFARWFGSSAPRHVPPGVLQDFVEALLPAKAMARVQAHLGTCAPCAREAKGWRAIVTRLDRLDRLAPAGGFAERVMDGFALSSNRHATAIPVRARLLSAARRLVPQTREAWAALSGVAVTPVVIVGLVAYAAFSHPNLTLGSLAAFVGWQVADLVNHVAAGVGTTVLQSAELFGLESLLRALVSAPSTVAGGVLVYSAASALALRVLYKNLISNRLTRGGHVHVSTAS